MKRNIIFIILILWMALVFTFSHQRGEDSSKLSSGFIRQIIDITPVLKDMSEVQKKAIIKKFHTLVRKLAHFSIYAVGGIIVFLWLSTYNMGILKTFILAIGICFLYAVSDETHQLYIPNRGGEIRDVMIDTFGAIIGSSMALIIFKISSMKKRTIRSMIS